MLSYQKEEQNGPAVRGTQTPETRQESSAAHSEDYLTVAGHKKRLKQSTIILIAVFVVGAFGVWMMIRKAVPSVAAAAAAAQKKDEVTEIETAVAQLNGMQSEVSSQMKNVTARLNHLSEVGQIAVEDLRKNPFARVRLADQTNADDPMQKQFAEEQTRRNAAGLQLWSITASPVGACCMINDKLLHLGDKIEGFSVREIRTASVIVEQNGIKVELKLE
jgi:preprotein translocase subunit SecG